MTMSQPPAVLQCFAAIFFHFSELILFLQGESEDISAFVTLLVDP